MDQESILRQRRPEEIRQQLEATRSSLAHKLESLEHEVRSAVQNTVGSLQNQASEAVQAVKQTLDVRHHVVQHPWAMLGGSLALGYVIGTLLSRERAAAPQLDMKTSANPSAEARETVLGLESALPADSGSRHAPRAVHTRATQADASPASILQELGKRLEPELQELKTLAISAAADLLRELIRQAIESARQPPPRSLAGEKNEA